MNEEVIVFTFNGEQFDHIAGILEEAFNVDPDNELLETFIAALDTADMIVLREEGQSFKELFPE